jgi:hypothetical protein
MNSGSHFSVDIEAGPARAAVLVLRAAIAGTPGLEGALGRLATALRAPDGGAVSAHMCWQLAADAVLGTNVEGRLLRAAGADAVPPPVTLAGRTPAGALDACRAWYATAASAGTAPAQHGRPPVLRGLRRPVDGAAGLLPDRAAEPAGSPADWTGSRRSAAVLLEGLGGTAGPVDPGVTRVLDRVLSGRLPIVPDDIRAAVLAQLVRAEQLTTARLRAERTESGQPRATALLAPAPH